MQDFNKLIKVNLQMKSTGEKGGNSTFPHFSGQAF